MQPAGLKRWSPPGTQQLLVTWNTAFLEASHYKENVELLEHVQRTIKLVMALENKNYEEQMRELELLSLKKSKLRGRPIAVYSFLKGGCSWRMLV